MAVVTRLEGGSASNQTSTILVEKAQVEVEKVACTYCPVESPEPEG
jgi:hypothetical protein